MSDHETPRPGARRTRPLTVLGMGLATLLLASACAGGESGDASSGSPHPESSSASASSETPAPAPQKREGEGQGDPAALAGVHLSVGEDRVPHVKLDGELKADKPSTRVLTAGTGELPRDGDTVKVSTAVVDPATGKVLEENFTGTPLTAPLSAQVKEAYPEMHELFTTNAVGSDVAAYWPVQDVPVPAPSSSVDGSATPSPSSSTLPAQLFVYRIEGIVPKTASGAEVEDLDSRLPSVTVGEDGKPTIGKPTGTAPGELVVQPLIQGEGAEVGEDDTLTVQYTGVKWSDGSTFDSSWDRGEAARFPLKGVIAGWTEGLKGQKVGSRVLLSIPAEKAYGDKGTPDGKIGPDEPLLFVVDVLDAEPTPAAPQN